MKMKFAVLFLVAVLAAVEAQLEFPGGQVFGSGVARPVIITPVLKKYTTVNRQISKYSGGNEQGQYKPDNSGGDDGSYHPDNSGAYVHQDQKYIHQADKFGGSGGGDRGLGRPGADGQSKDSAYRAGVKKVGPVVSILVNSGVKFEGPKSIGTAGFGEGVNLQQGSAQGKYDNKNYAIIRQTGTVEEDGYQYLYETENGILGEEQGKLANIGTDNEAMHATGFFTYTGPDAIVYTVNYVSDENGFVPDAVHLPTPPPVPEYILRALDYQRSIGTLVD